LIEIKQRKTVIIEIKNNNNNKKNSSEINENIITESE
jgi:hypothetical protein